MSEPTEHLPDVEFVPAESRDEPARRRRFLSVSVLSVGCVASVVAVVVIVASSGSRGGHPAILRPTPSGQAIGTFGSASDTSSLGVDQQQSGGILRTTPPTSATGLQPTLTTSQLQAPVTLGATPPTHVVVVVPGSTGSGTGPGPARSGPGPTVNTSASSSATFTEEAYNKNGVPTFTDYTNASGTGPTIPFRESVQVTCKVYDPSIGSSTQGGYWYKIASAPWSNGYYAVANTFLNGDPPGGPYTHYYDPKVTDC